MRYHLIKERYNFVLVKKQHQEIVLNLNNVFFLSNGLYNLVNLALLNNNGICHNNKNKTLYDLKTKDCLLKQGVEIIVFSFNSSTS